MVTFTFEIGPTSAVRVQTCPLLFETLGGIVSKLSLGDVIKTTKKKHADTTWLIRRLLPVRSLF